ncbi:MAG: phospho-N-acetylmuramoyl-pentapeptide-transferase [Firmicutes bacterium]|nr:phospho-N-acetylmuramoyl-pentapeptide-transferase [Bacillota bacterium]
MLILAKAILAFMIGFLIAIVFGLIMIPMLKKLKIRQTVSSFVNKHSKKNGTPTMGGIIFIIPTIISIIVLLLLNKLNITYNLVIVLFVFLAYALLGFIDDYLIIKRRNNIGLSEFQKLVGQVIIAVIFFVLFMKGGNEPILDIYTFGIKLNMGWLYGIFILFMLVASSNAVNITDGLDGLAGGLSAIAFLAFGLISWASIGISGSEDIGIFCFILLGALMAFLFYNTHPAKVFMGDTGSLSLGGTLAAVAIVTNHELTLIIVAGVFVVETLVCIIQRASVRFTGKRVFLMTPLHHHFEKLGWEETDIVKLFWVFGIILAAVAILWGVWI